MVSKIITIDDLFKEGKQKKIRIPTGGLFLIPQYNPVNKNFLYNPFRLGVVESFGEKEEKLVVDVKPCYEVKMPEDDNFMRAKIREVYGCFFADFFPFIVSGSAEEISFALRRAPFYGMNKLADEIKMLDVPYKKSLKELFERINERFNEKS